MSKRIYEVDLMVIRALGQPKTLAQLVPHMGMSRETIRLALLRLRERGTVASNAGLYRLAYFPEAA